MISNIVIDNPVTRQRESLTQAQFNSYMAQTNGAVLKWIIEPVAKHGTHDQSTHGSWATGVGKNWTTRTEKDRTIFSQDRGPKLLEVSIANKNLANPKNKKDFEDALSTIDILNDAFPIAGSVHFGVSELGGNGRIASTWSTVMEFGVTSPAQIAQISVGHEWFNVPKDMQTHILTHEWGHANDFRPSEVAKSQANNFSEALFQDSEIPMTEYGLSSDREAYAEAFAIKFNNSHKGGIYSSDVQQTDKWEEVFKIFELDTVNKALGKRVSFKVWDTFDANNPPKLIEDYDPLVLKHESHDQKTHGSWANGVRANDITEECKSYFGTDVMGYQTSEAKREIQKRTDSAKVTGRAHENYILEIVAEKQGFANKPKVVSSEEIDQLEKDGWTIAYRGIKDFQERGWDSVKWKAKTLAEEFRTGNYHAGAGTDGDGLYFTTDRQIANGYAYPNGRIIKVAIPPNSTLTANEFNDEIISHKEKINKGGVGDFWGADDIGVSLASKGVRGARSTRLMGFGGIEGGRNRFTKNVDVFVIWDRSMLVVQEEKSE